MKEPPKYLVDATRHPGTHQIWEYDDLAEASKDIKLELAENPEAVLRLYKLVTVYGDCK